MSEDTRSNISIGKEVVLWLVSSYVSAVSTVLLACFLGFPIAWLATVLNLSKGAFLILSVVPIAVSVYTIQRGRVGERTVNALVASVFKLTVDIGQVQFVRIAHQIWHAMQHFKEEEMADWIALYKMVQRVRKDVSNFKRAIYEHNAVVEQLQDWAMAPGPVPASVSDVSQMIQRQRELMSQISSLVDRIDYNQQILFEEAAATRKEREIVWSELQSQLKHAEKLLAPTLWARVESMRRHQWLSAHERSYRRQREDVVAWLASPFDPFPAAQAQKALITPLVDRTIHCRNGQVKLNLLELVKVGA